MYCEKCGKELTDGEECLCCSQEQNLNQSKKGDSKAVEIIKKIIKGILWLMVIVLIISGFGAKSGMGTSMDGILEIVDYYVVLIFLVLIPLLVVLNFKGVRGKLPLFKKRKLSLSILAFCIMSIILSVACTIISTGINGLHTEEYEIQYEEYQEFLKAEEQKKVEEETALEEHADVKEFTQNDQELGESYTHEETTYSEEYGDLEFDDTSELDSTLENGSYELPVYSMEYLNGYIENNNIDIPKERYKSKMKKVFNDNSEMIAVEASGGEKVRYSATVENSEFYYVGKLKNNRPDGWGKIIRVVIASESEYYGRLIADINTIGWGWDEEELVPLLVYVGEFNDGYYSGYGWKYADYFDDNELYVRKIGYDYARTSDNVMENILLNCNPVEYMGEFQKGLYDGDGILISYGAREVAPYMTDEEQIDSFGVIVDREIEFYIGEFRKGLLRGSGKHYILGKLLYEGEYYDWQYDGKGTLYYGGTTQIKYEGNWQKGKYHGKGTLYNEDGSVKYKGKWKMGDYDN